MSIPKTVSSLALLIGLAVVMTLVPAGKGAAAVMCPQFLAKYCIVEKDGFKHTQWTNGCFAKQRGLKVLHMGACRAR